MIHTGDCVEVMATLEPATFDAIVTDPPYGLEFMGKDWDKLGAVTLTDPSSVGGFQDGNGGNPFSRSRVRYGSSAKSMQAWHQAWAEAAYRVAKPSAYLLAFGGTRTVHRLACAIEDAGWIIRDQLVWGYASGFPKSKASLKPAWEPIVMARKPGPLRELGIDACRIPISAEDAEAIRTAGGYMAPGWQGPDTGIYNKSGDVTIGATPEPLGRWPANIVLTDAIFDAGVEGVVGGGETAPGVYGLRAHAGDTWGAGIPTSDAVTTIDKVGGYDDRGTYSRFFLVPKAARSDREPVLGSMSGLDGVDAATVGIGALRDGGRGSWTDHELPFDAFNRNVGNTVAARRRNSHPTVKPVDLMRHLVRLVTPLHGTVLDPFLGSGTTAIAAEMEGFDWTGIEKQPEYVAIAEARLNGTQRGFGL